MSGRSRYGRSRNDGGMVPKGTSTSQPVAPRVGSSCSVSLACEAGPFLGGREAADRKLHVRGQSQGKRFPTGSLGCSCQG